MRGRLGFLAAVVILGALIGGTSASAAQPPQPVATVSVHSTAQRPAHPRGTNFSPLVVVSWTGEDPAASGVVACLTRGTTPSQDARSCDVRQDVPAPGTQTGQLRLQPQTSFAIAVFSYTDGSTRTYSSPQTTVWHGSVFDGRGAYYLDYGQHVRLTASLHDQHTTEALPGQTVTLLFAATGSDTLHQVTKLTTDSQGNVAISFQPRRRGDYFWVYDGADGHLPVSRQTTIYLRYRITAHLTSSRAVPGQSVQIYGVVMPTSNTAKPVQLDEYQAAAGPCPAGYYDTGQRAAVKRQRLPNGQTAFGYVMTIRSTAVGTHKFETYIPTDNRLVGRVSPSVTLTVGSAAAARGSTRASPTTPSC